MSAINETLNQAARIVRDELTKHLPHRVIINDVEAENRPAEDDDYIHIVVILEDYHPELTTRDLLKFRHAMQPMFEKAGIVPSPTISYANRSELKR